MYHVKTMNKISKIGLAELDDRFEISDTMEHEDAILVRSAKLHDYDFPAELLCIARAGAVVAAGTIVPPKSLVVGVPGKVKKTLTDEDVAGSIANAESYLGLMAKGMADPENQK